MLPATLRAISIPSVSKDLEISRSPLPQAVRAVERSFSKIGIITPLHSILSIQ